MSDLSAPGTTVALLAGHALGEREKAAWRAFQRADPALASPFLRPEVVAALSRHRDSVRVAVVERAGEVLALLPFEQRRLGLARAAGYDLFDHQALLCAPDLAWGGRELLAACGLVAFEFDHLVPTQVPAFSPRAVVLQDSPVLDLAGGYEAWLAGRRQHSSSRLKKALQKRRKLERELPDVRFELDCRDPRSLEVLMAWKSAQYRRTGRADRFARPGVAATVRELFATRSDGFAGVLSVLWSGERPLALSFGLRSDGVYAGWFPTYDVELAVASPGLVQLLCLVEALAGDGVRQMDLGEGEADYKETFKTGDLRVAEGVVDRPSPVAAARRLQRAPGQLATGFVLAHPPLRRAARRALRVVGLASSGLRASSGVRAR